MQDGHCYRIPTSWKKLPDSQTDYRTQTKMNDTVNTGGQFKVSCFAEESARYTMAYGLKTKHYRRTSGD